MLPAILLLLLAWFDAPPAPEGWNLDTCVTACMADDDGPALDETQCAQLCSEPLAE
jgi:hypothetical protein